MGAVSSRADAGPEDGDFCCFRARKSRQRNSVASPDETSIKYPDVSNQPRARSEMVPNESAIARNFSLRSPSNAASFVIRTSPTTITKVVHVQETVPPGTSPPKRSSHKTAVPHTAESLAPLRCPSLPSRARLSPLPSFENIRASQLARMAGEPWLRIDTGVDDLGSVNPELLTTSPDLLESDPQSAETARSVMTPRLLTSGGKTKTESPSSPRHEQSSPNTNTHKLIPATSTNRSLTADHTDVPLPLSITASKSVSSEQMSISSNKQFEEGNEGTNENVSDSAGRLLPNATTTKRSPSWNPTTTVILEESGNGTSQLEAGLEPADVCRSDQNLVHSPALSSDAHSAANNHDDLYVPAIAPGMRMPVGSRLLNDIGSGFARPLTQNRPNVRASLAELDQTFREDIVGNREGDSWKRVSKWLNPEGIMARTESQRSFPLRKSLLPETDKLPGDKMADRQSYGQHDDPASSPIHANFGNPRIAPQKRLPLRPQKSKQGFSMRQMLSSRKSSESPKPTQRVLSEDTSKDESGNEYSLISLPAVIRQLRAPRSRPSLISIQSSRSSISTSQFPLVPNTLPKPRTDSNPPALRPASIEDENVVAFSTKAHESGSHMSPFKCITEQSPERQVVAASMKTDSPLCDSPDVPNKAPMSAIPENDSLRSSTSYIEDDGSIQSLPTGTGHLQVSHDQNRWPDVRRSQVGIAL